MSARPSTDRCRCAHYRCPAHGQVLCRGGTALPLSRDHKPSNEGEMARIHAAGGWITGQGRVNGNLNLSRSIGDQQYKVDQALPPEAQLITAMPDVHIHQLRWVEPSYPVSDVWSDSSADWPPPGCEDGRSIATIRGVSPSSPPRRLERPCTTDIYLHI